MSTVLENREPYKTVLGFGTLLAEDGKPMHKSWGNSIEFNEGADKIGVDVMRWLYLRQNPADNLLFGYKIADEVRRKFHIKLWNSYNYFVTYANIDEWKPSTELKTPNPNNILDTWILNRLYQTISQVEKVLERYDSQSAAITLETFVDDLSNWYIRRSRERTGFTALSNEDKNSFYETIYYSLVQLMKVLAPFTPFISDSIYHNLTKDLSVHLVDWPENKNEVDESLIREMQDIRDLAEKVHAVRKVNQIPVRQPLAKLTVSAPFEIKNEKLLTVLKEEVNIKEVELKKGNETEINLDTKITPELEEEAKARELIRKIQQERKDIGVLMTQKVNVVSPWLPEKQFLIDKIKKATLTEDLQIGDFKINTI
jgi:isoleucyl-tRNA synthetase